MPSSWHGLNYRGLHETPLIPLVNKSAHFGLEAPQGAIYAFIDVSEDFGLFDDEDFARHTLETQRILVTPGSAFSLKDSRSFRITFLPEPRIMQSRLIRALR